MLSDLVAGYSSSEGDSEEEEKPSKKEEGEEKDGKKEGVNAASQDATPAEPEAKPKRKLPSASAMMSSASSWARHDTTPAPQAVDQPGKRYNNVPPPVSHSLL
jgi:hypothetical protein